MATSLVSKLVIFSILINFSASVLMIGLVDNNGDPIFTSANSVGYDFENQDDADDLILDLEKDVSPGGSIDDRGDQIYRVLDTIGLGFILKFLEAINNAMFGFIDLLGIILAPMLDEPLRNLLFGSTESGFGLLKTILLVAYTLYGISLFTGKNVVEGI